jgi:tRNA(adenine34) deaminase
VSERKEGTVTLAEHERWMHYALALASRGAEAGEVPVGAVVVRDGKVIGEGWNQPIGAHDPTAHAEIVALRQAAVAVGNYRLPEAVLYVTVEPCTMCAGAIVHARVSMLVYGTPEPKAGAIASRTQVLEQPAMNWRVESLGGVLAQECQNLMSDFFRRRRASRKAATGSDSVHVADLE